MGEWISTSEASKVSGYHAEHIRKLIRERRVKARKFMILWLVSRSSLMAYLREQGKHGEKRGRKSSH
jgi:excisionase family DNA binding protein